MRLPIVLLFVIIAGSIGVWFLRQPDLPAAERGRRIAEREGCFTCHGPAGTKGSPNPGRTDKTAPSFAGDLMMYADDANDVRAWILDGGTPAKRASHSWQDQRSAGALRMPAFRGVLNGTQISDLVAYVMAVSDSPEPQDSLALAGRDRAKALGCTGCHGYGGRLAPNNPGSFKGCIPSWDSKDFSELVGSEREFGQWVQHGVSERFRANPAAWFFLKRARLHMPAYEKHLAEGDLKSLWAYVGWLRSPASSPDSATVTSF